MEVKTSNASDDQRKSNNNVFLENCDLIIQNFVCGDWQEFFNTWNENISSEIKDSDEFKILTLKLRVHFAILPIRIVHLQQNNDSVFNKSIRVKKLLENVADKFSSVDDEKDSDDEKSELTINNMNQLKDFLNSYNGQKLTEELQHGSFKSFFALPYIVNPEEDASMKEIFSIDWLEELTLDLEKFISNLKNQFLLSDNENHANDTKLDETELENRSKLQHRTILNSQLSTESKSKLSDNNKIISCDRIIQSAIKNKEIEDWISSNKHLANKKDLSTKSSQTRISGVKIGTGFSLVGEQNTASIVSPSVFSELTKQSTLYKDELNLTKSRLFSIHKHYQKLKTRFHKLHIDYQKMNEIAEVLTIALESSVQGQPVNLDMILQSCMKIFPDRFNRDIQTDSEDTTFEFKEDFPTNVSSLKNKQLPVNCTIVVPPKFLDYENIKLDLKNGDSRTKLLLLEALRHKLTRYQPNHRDESIFEYVNENLLGLGDNVVDGNESILSSLLQPLDVYNYEILVQQSIARFLNALSSLSCGRTYLTSGPSVLNVIIKYLDSYNSGTGDAITLDMLLATLQKMSLRREQRNYMIEANLVEWLIYHLSNENFRMGTYRLEYTCALLMNLSLHSMARTKASVIAPLFTSILTGLLSTDCTSILPYVNGALQNFLLNDEINEEAKKLHLAEILEYYCTKCSDELRNNFLHTLRIHRRECDENLTDDDEFPDEDDELFDVLENEIEEDDPVRIITGELHGDNFLAKHYMLSKNHLIEKEFKQSFQRNEKSLSTESKNARMIAVSSETKYEDVTEQRNLPVDEKSRTDVAKSTKKVKKHEMKSQTNDEEAVFLSKPKLLRTPPVSARTKN